jgi:hypothetical protein
MPDETFRVHSGCQPWTLLLSQGTPMNVDSVIRDFEVCFCYKLNKMKEFGKPDPDIRNPRDHITTGKLGKVEQDQFNHDSLGGIGGIFKDERIGRFFSSCYP